MFLSSGIMYLVIRKSSLLKIPSQINNLAMFLVPLFAYLIIGIVTKQDFLLSFWQYLIIIVESVLFSYLGNVSSLKSIEYAPNAGYSLVISKSYVVFTTIIAVLFLNAELTVLKTVAIILIVIFSALIMINKNTIKKNVKSLWLPLSFTAFFCWGMLSLTSKYLFNQGVNTFVFLSFTYFIVSSLIGTEIKNKQIELTPIMKFPLTFLSIGILSTTFNLGLFQAIKYAPNVGYVNAINAASISLVTILSILLFKDEFNLRKVIGVFGVIAGLVMLLI